MAALSYWNARAPMVSRPSLQSIRSICALKNASSPMVFSVDGSFTYTRLLSRENAPLPISSSPSGRISAKME